MPAYQPKSGTDTYKVVSNVTIKGVGAIGLEHTLRQSRTTPEDTFKAFVEDMLGEALKVSLAYWEYAYNQGAVPLLGYLTDIMNLTKDPET